MKCFPLDCTTECPHFKTWDLSIDDWTSVCDILNVQIDDCDGDIIRYRCPLDSDKHYQNTLQEGRWSGNEDRRYTPRKMSDL
jgi:hypothetical protein